MERNMYNTEKEEVEIVAGDRSGPTSVVGNPYTKQGQTQSWELDKNVIARPQIRYKQQIIFCELYEMDGNLSLHIMCPQCLNMLWVREPNKKVDWSNGVISTEPFSCTWELNPNDPMRMFGVSLCRWSVGVQNGVALDHKWSY
jgi:hypothetical protein